MRNLLKSQSRRSRLALAGGTVAALVAIPAGLAAASTGSPASPASSASSAPKPTIVIEHGAWAGGSSFNAVVARLQRDGYTVDVPSNPLRGPASDSAYLAAYLATVKGPVVLVGHSYGGFVTTDAATGDRDVKALVYVDAYLPAQGETINSINAKFPGSLITPASLIFVPSPGGVTDAYVQPAQFASIFANDLPKSEAAVLAATQEPISAAALAGASTAPAWASIPSWDVIGTADHAITPAAQEFMAARAHAKVTRVNASHLSMISHPATVAAVIEQAARATS